MISWIDKWLPYEVGFLWNGPRQGRVGRCWSSLKTKVEREQLHNPNRPLRNVKEALPSPRLGLLHERRSCGSMAAAEDCARTFVVIAASSITKAPLDMTILHAARN